MKRLDRGSKFERIQHLEFLEGFLTTWLKDAPTLTVLSMLGIVKDKLKEEKKDRVIH